MVDVTDFKYLSDPAFHKNRTTFADPTLVRAFFDDANESLDDQRPIALNLLELAALFADGNAQVTASTGIPAGGTDDDVHFQYVAVDNRLDIWKRVGGAWGVILPVPLGELNTTDLVFDPRGDALRGDPPAAPATWTHGIVMLTDNTVEYYTSNGTVGTLVATVVDNVGGVGNEVTANTNPPSGGDDGDVHFQYDAPNIQLRIWKKLTGVWTPIQDVPLGLVNSDMLFQERANANQGVEPPEPASTWTHAVVVLTDNTVELWESDGVNKSLTTTIIDQVGAGGAGNEVTSSELPPTGGDDGDVHLQYDVPNARIRFWKRAIGVWNVDQDIPMNTNPATTASDAPPAGGIDNDVHFEYDDTNDRMRIHKRAAGAWAPIQDIPLGTDFDAQLYYFSPATPDRDVQPVPGDVGVSTWGIGSLIYKVLSTKIVELWRTDTTTTTEATPFRVIFPDDTQPLLAFPPDSNGWKAGDYFAFYDGTSQSMKLYLWEDTGGGNLQAFQKPYEGAQIQGGGSTMFYEQRADALQNVPPNAPLASYTHAIVMLTDNTVELWESDGVSAARVAYVTDQVGVGGGGNITSSTLPPSGGADGDTHFQWDSQSPNGRIRIWQRIAGSWTLLQDIPLNENPAIDAGANAALPPNPINNDYFINHDTTLNELQFFKANGGVFSDQLIVPLSNANTRLIYESRGNAVQDQPPANPATWTHAIVFLNDDTIEFWESNGTVGTKTYFIEHPPAAGGGLGVIEGKLGSAPPLARCRYMAQATQATPPVVNFTPASGLYTLDITDGILLTADFHVRDSDIVSNQIILRFSGDGFTGNDDTRFPSRVDLIQQPDLNGVYPLTHGVATGQVAGNFDDYQVTGLIGGASYRMIVNF